MANVNFEVSKSYFMRSVTDYQCVWTYQVIKRTAKTLTLQAEDGKTTTHRISEHEDIEQVKPLGSYSMCPILSADNLIPQKDYRLVEWDDLHANRDTIIHYINQNAISGHLREIMLAMVERINNRDVWATFIDGEWATNLEAFTSEVITELHLAIWQNPTALRIIHR